MDWKKILLKDFCKFRNVLMKAQPGVVDLIGPVHKRANETQLYHVNLKLSLKMTEVSVETCF